MQGNRFATAAPPDARDYIVEEEEAEEGEAEENVTPAQNSALIIAVDTNETVADPSTQEKETGNATKRQKWYRYRLILSIYTIV